jgi:D-alanyl-D-alanine carboxypeptidase (penicillin-binding protein 5/6)
MNSYLELEKRPEIIDKALNEFYFEMNSHAHSMKLKDTHFLSAHGMHHDRNYSSAYDIAVVSFYCMKNPTFA